MKKIFGGDFLKHNNIIRGIIICMVVLLCALAVILATPVGAYEGTRITTERQEALHRAADILRSYGIPDDDPAIRTLSDAWWQEQENLDILAKVVRYEADPAYCEWEHSVAVAVVVLNRVNSAYFPNTVKEVVAAPGQYLTAYTYGFENTPSLCYEVAKAALDGDHDVPSDCYWQDTSIQGTAIWKAFVCDTGWFKSTTYICRGIPGVS